MLCNAAGQVVLKRKTTWRDDTTNLVMSPLEFMQQSNMLALGRDARASDCFKAINSGERVSPRGRPLSTANVGFPVAQLGCQLSGGEIARPTEASRPDPDGRNPKLAAGKQSLNGHRPEQAKLRLPSCWLGFRCPPILRQAESVH
jgi:hypothetical protein